MDKLNITKGEWYPEKYSDGSVGISCNGHMICEVNDAYREITPNAKAIVTAVNNTYKQGIDPEAVPELVDVLEEAKKFIGKLPASSKNSLNKNGVICLSNIEQALKKAEL